MTGHDIGACMRATTKNMRRIRSGITDQMARISADLAHELAHSATLRKEAWDAHKAYIEYAKEHRKDYKDAISAAKDEERNKKQGIAKLRSQFSDAREGTAPEAEASAPEL